MELFAQQKYGSSCVGGVHILLDSVLDAVYI